MIRNSIATTPLQSRTRSVSALATASGARANTKQSRFTGKGTSGSGTTVNGPSVASVTVQLNVHSVRGPSGRRQSLEFPARSGTDRQPDQPPDAADNPVPIFKTCAGCRSVNRPTCRASREVPAPHRAAISAGSGSIWCRQSLHQTVFHSSSRAARLLTNQYSCLSLVFNKP